MLNTPSKDNTIQQCAILNFKIITPQIAIYYNKLLYQCMSRFVYVYYKYIYIYSIYVWCVKFNVIGRISLIEKKYEENEKKKIVFYTFFQTKYKPEYLHTRYTYLYII